MASLARLLAWNNNVADAIIEYRKILNGGQGELSEKPPYLTHDEISLLEIKNNLGSPFDSINPIPDWIIHWELAHALRADNKLDEALSEYEQSLEKNPTLDVITLEIASLFLSQGKIEDARDAIKDLPIETLDEDSRLLMSDIYTALNEYNIPLPTIPEAYIEELNSSGDFYTSEKILRYYLEEHPHDYNALFKLAMLLGSIERYEEAKGLLLSLLSKKPNDLAIQHALADIFLREKKFDFAQEYALNVLSKNHDDPKALTILGDSLGFIGHYDTAIEQYTRLAHLDEYKIEGFNKIASLFAKKGDHVSAKNYWTRVKEIDVSNPEANYYLAENAVDDQRFIDALIQNNNDKELLSWARLYASHGSYDHAIALYKKIISTNIQSISLKLELALTLASNRQYTAALDILRDLSKKHPNHYKILLYHARFLGWSKQYAESIAVYQNIISMNPSDPVPRREMARTAAWGSMKKAAKEYYSSALSPSVDSRLALIVTQFAATIKDPTFLKDFSELISKHTPAHIYEGYELIYTAYYKQVYTLPTDFDIVLENTLDTLKPLYEIQKSISLEYNEKKYFWDKRYYTAINALKELIAFNPGNEEAIFDLGQIQCILGLQNESQKAYQQLLTIDPQHSLAREVLQRISAKNSPHIAGTYDYWKENGHGELSGVTRKKAQLTFSLPIRSQHELCFSPLFWEERFSDNSHVYTADGFSLNITTRPTKDIVTDLHYEQKRYKNHEGIYRTGAAHIRSPFGDIMTGGIEYARNNEISNLFALQQRSQSDTISIYGESNMTAKSTVFARFRALRYQDNNRGEYHTLRLSYDISEYPHTLSIAAEGEYRHTSERTVYQFSDGILTNITHPYWTPHHYLGHSLMLKWSHDISKQHICGLESHYYDISFALGNDTDHNAMMKGTATWHYEFKERWTVHLALMIHRSKSWDAENLNILCNYLF